MNRHGRSLLITEVALWLVTAAAIFGMHRLFIDGTYRSPVLFQATLAHILVAWLRRWRLGLVPAAAVTAVGAILALSWFTYPDTTTALLPTLDTWRLALDDLRAAWQLFQDVRAPAPVDDGFLMASGAAVWVMVYVADWAAFRARATFEALLPAATLFLFAAALGAPGGRVAGATVFAAAAMLFVLLQRTLEQEESSNWAASHRARSRWSLLGTGATLIFVAVTAGAATGPNLPGANAEAVLAWRDMGDEDETRIVISPMVDIQTRLVEQSNVELFTVKSPVASYWRLTSLDQFDGQVWRSSYGTNDADGSLPRAVDSSVESEAVTQTVTVSALAAVWLPAAYEPSAIDPGPNDVDWDERSSTLIVDKDVESSDGFTYDVTSNVPQWSAGELRTATADVPSDIAERYLERPPVAPEVEALAHQLTDDQPTPYDKALALQDYLRTFRYDLNVQRGHGNDALMTFLFEKQRGYCEQFAGAFAAMARTVDLPSRVAVGFTPGDLDPEQPGLYHVRGIHAHAWAEVYLDGFGWVTLDPTPGRAPPRAEDWLGMPADQATPGGEGSPGIPGSNQDGGTGTPTSPAEPSGDDQRTGTGVDPGGDTGGIGGVSDGGSAFAEAVRTAAGPVAMAILAYLVLVPIAIGVQHVVRRRRARHPTARVRLAWRDIVDRAVATGVDLPPSLTVAESADRLAATLPGGVEAVRRLARSMEQVAYAEVVPPPDEVDRAVEARAAVLGELRLREPTARRVVRYLDGRELWRRGTRRQRRTASTAAVARVATATGR